MLVLVQRGRGALRPRLWSGVDTGRGKGRDLVVLVMEVVGSRGGVVRGIIIMEVGLMVLVLVLVLRWGSREDGRKGMRVRDR